MSGSGEAVAVDNAETPQQVLIRVIPRARRDEVGGERNGRLLVRTTAAPVDGSANAAVLRLLATHFNVPVRRVHLISGERSRDKVVAIDAP